MDLHGKTYEQLWDKDWLTYDLSLVGFNKETQSSKIFKCPSGTPEKCRVTMSRWYTPVLYYLQPPVMYYGSETAFYVDPRST